MYWYLLCKEGHDLDAHDAGRCDFKLRGRILLKRFHRFMRRAGSELLFRVGIIKIGLPGADLAKKIQPPEAFLRHFGRKA